MNHVSRIATSLPPLLCGGIGGIRTPEIWSQTEGDGSGYTTIPCIYFVDRRGLKAPDEFRSRDIPFS